MYIINSLLRIVTIVNEHPVTIYPGRASPTRRQSNRQLSNELRPRDSLRMLDQENASTNHVTSNSPTIVNPAELSFSLDPPSSLEPLDSLASNHQPFDREKLHHSDWETRSNKRKSSDCDDFSDDSLEGLSLPPPPPPLVVPPPPSLSAPVTPNKRASVAWEISLDSREQTTPRKHAQSSHAQQEVHIYAYGISQEQCTDIFISRVQHDRFKKPAHQNPNRVSRIPTKVQQARQSSGQSHQKCQSAVPKTKLAHCIRTRKNFCWTFRAKSKTMERTSFGRDDASVIYWPIW